MRKVLELQDKVLKALEDKLEGFFLVGGTALSVHYFHHRESYDLDFFTKDFSRTRISKIIAELSRSIGLEIELVKEELGEDRVKHLIYLVGNKKRPLKIDFVQDVHPLLKPFRMVNGIPVLSKEDIYLRKIYAICGASGEEDAAGRRRFIGGRQEAKDFFDLYFLSKTFMPLSEFAAAYCHASQIESIVVWYRTYDRMAIKLGLHDIITNKTVVYQDMEGHFKEEIDKLIEKGT